MDLKVWEPIVREALEEGIQVSAGPVPGARLRQLIARRAADVPLDFPPDGSKAFGGFLDQFPDILFVQRRPGRDMLVVPASNVALLSTPNERPQISVVRRDLFEALTLFPKPGQTGPYYVRSTDKVVWPEPGAESVEGTVALPVSSQEIAVQIRRDFATQAQPKEVRAALDESLAHPKPLRAFSEALRIHGLARQWHQFRAGKVLERLRAWGQENDVPWRADWFLEGEQVASQGLGTAPGPTGTSNVQEFFAALSAVLKEGDLARISVPLDLVSRAWSHRG